MLRPSCPLFAPVSRNESGTVAELVDGQNALVFTSFTSAVAVLHRKALQLICGQHGGFCPFQVILHSDQGAAVSAHKSRNIGPHDFFSYNLLDAPQHGIVHKGSALDNDFIASFICITQFYYLIQSILYDRIGQSGRDIPY